MKIEKYFMLIPHSIFFVLGELIGALILAIEAVQEFSKAIDELMTVQRIKKYQGGFWSYLE